MIFYWFFLLPTLISRPSIYRWIFHLFLIEKGVLKSLEIVLYSYKLILIVRSSMDHPDHPKKYCLNSYQGQKPPQLSDHVLDEFLAVEWCLLFPIQSQKWRQPLDRAMDRIWAIESHPKILLSTDNKYGSSDLVLNWYKPSDRVNNLSLACRLHSWLCGPSGRSTIHRSL